jgi:hypothetical protein
MDVVFSFVPWKSPGTRNVFDEKAEKATSIF